MKCFNLFILFLVTHSGYAEVIMSKRDPLATDIIQQLMEILRGIITSGIPEKDVPVLDPFELKGEVQFTTPGGLLSIKANTENGSLTGLGQFQLLEFNFDKEDISLDLILNFPVLTLQADYYNMDGNIYQAIPLSGRGFLHFETRNVKFWSKIYLMQSDNKKSIIIKSFQDPQYSIEQIVSNTEIDKNIDDIFNAMVEELLAEYLNRFSKYITTTYSNSVIEAINKFLSKFESWRQMAFIL